MRHAKCVSLYFYFQSISTSTPYLNTCNKYYARSYGSSLELYPLLGAAVGGGRGPRVDVELGHGGGGRGGDAALGAQGGGHRAPRRGGLAASLFLLGGQVDAHLDRLSLLQRQVQLLWWHIFLLLNLFFNLEYVTSK